ncbi:MAG: hypothetical protein AB7V16_13645 [Vulcanibacillus sp.]
MCRSSFDGDIIFSSGLTVHAALSGHSSGETRDELHQDTVAVTVNEDAPAITFLTHGLGARTKLNNKKG